MILVDAKLLTQCDLLEIVLKMVLSTNFKYNMVDRMC